MCTYGMPLWRRGEAWWEDRGTMAAEEGQEEYVYRIGTAEEWEQMQKEGFAYGGDLDKSTGCFHLSKLSQVQSTLQNFFLNFKGDLYLLQVDAKKLGDGLVYEVVDGVNSFPHYYGPSRSFILVKWDAGPVVSCFGRQPSLVGLTCL
ncbi:hypothetical protein CRG98_045582 [Punica granatum]|uniref:DUF952 domain-containing protein n=1 Tax=Punica granatum TaxID=22663 RepID=A0A2I0HQN6_PUNGR|nr:hypothetical protein CRG98_045582 [Punica granatum]